MMISCGFLLQPERPPPRLHHAGRFDEGAGAEDESGMRAVRLTELKEIAAKLLETARGLPPGQDRDNALQEVARFRARITGLQRQDLRSAQRKLKAKGK
jgi:hypothetical protein